MNELIFCSNNNHKLQEIRKMLPFGYVLHSLSEAEIESDIDETGTTFQENAFLKASAVALLTKKNCFADDSGLCVTALNDAPGIYSARYAGKNATDAENRRKLLADLSGIMDRKAFFVTVICLIFEGKAHYFEGRIYGSITLAERGGSGFGYDPVFMPDGYNRTFAEMTADEKNKISHRQIALGKMITFLNNLKV
ncbi:MAG TPA: RdgB/HAM1 family non-canonical purine NTP pyrophosphatase [Bacteroidia bacterium]|jgi:XTP/dITP diphosphohydrolase|nr:RdgB/HAM1 family non-canonical purine NTP pyrophosphatase [Bacteroidia bacterium]HMU20354.1 RdgB/HAM1 family non-canonical purine NTP pyrophosphatase [Bacteroidia bacterium]